MLNGVDGKGHAKAPGSGRSAAIIWEIRYDFGRITASFANRPCRPLPGSLWSFTRKTSRRHEPIRSMRASPSQMETVLHTLSEDRSERPVKKAKVR